MNRVLLCSAMLALFGSSAQAVPHFLAGLTPGPHLVFHEGVRVDSVDVSPGGVARFESDLRGRFEIVPVVVIPPTECAELVPLNVSAPAPCCANTPWNAFVSVRNDGSAPATAFRIRVTLAQPGGSPSIKCEYDVASLAIGATAGPFTCRLASPVPVTPVGNWPVVVWIDNTEAVCEGNELNNKVTL